MAQFPQGKSADYKGKKVHFLAQFFRSLDLVLASPQR